MEGEVDRSVLGIGAVRRRIAEASAVIRRQWARRARAGIVLGSGMGCVTELMNVETVIAYDEIPHFKHSTAIGHASELICGTWAGVPVVTMSGRCHLYEGHAASEVAFPVRVMRDLGTELLIATNASGGLNPEYVEGDVVMIEDHIDLVWDNPLRGPNDNALGPRFPDMSCVYDARLIECAMEAARRDGFTVHRGVYAAMLGPNYETPAEYRFLRTMGADMAGMSTVPEAITAAHCGMRVFAVSTITNVCRPSVLTATDGQAVAEVAARAELKLRTLLTAVLKQEADR